jgi:hypothetical protein
MERAADPQSAGLEEKGLSGEGLVLGDGVAKPVVGPVPVDCSWNDEKFR